MSMKGREAEEKRRKATRARFRNMIRSVMFNRLWLMDSGEQKLSLNVKKNIAMLVRQQRKVGMLTLAEKSLILTHHNLRTVDERRRLVMLFSGLTCFAKIPPKVRARLVPCIKFMYLGRGRKIIKEGDPPNTVYFVLTGEVEATKSVYDHVLKDYVDKVESICGSGDVIGDIEMVEEIPRYYTHMTTTECELLMVFRDDFDRVLRPVMSKQWLDKKSALLSLGYFDFLTESQVIGACKMGILRQFEPLETIYFEDKGHVTYVHFVISGECMILQCLQIEVGEKNGVRQAKLVDVTKVGSELSFEDMTNKELILKLKEVGESQSKPKFNVEDMIASAEDIMDEETKKKIMARKMDIKSIELACAQTRQAEIDARSEKSRGFSILQESSDVIECVEGEDCVDDVYKSDDDSTDLFMDGEENNYSRLLSDKQSIKSATRSKISLRSTATARSQRVAAEKMVDEKPAPATDSATKVSQHLSEGSMDSSMHTFVETATDSTAPSKGKATPIGPKIENHFIDVGSITFGGIFGLGERLEHRVIMARTTVQCLLLPRFFLLDKERNPGNIWQRRRFYLDATIPSRESLFEDFMTTRKWQKFKKDFILGSLDPQSNSNPTKLQDIPIICRIVEAND